MTYHQLNDFFAVFIQPDNGKLVFQHNDRKSVLKLIAILISENNVQVWRQSTIKFAHYEFNEQYSKVIKGFDTWGGI